MIQRRMFGFIRSEMRKMMDPPIPANISIPIVFPYDIEKYLSLYGSKLLYVTKLVYGS